MLTRGEQKCRSSVDYILRALIYDDIETIERIVDLEVSDHPTKTTLKKRIHAVVKLMKFYYAAHVGSTKYYAHNTDFALLVCHSEAEISPVSGCDRCLKPFQVLNNIRDEVGPHKNGILDTIEHGQD